MQVNSMVKNILWLLIGASLVIAAVAVWNNRAVGESAQPREISKSQGFSSEEQRIIDIFERNSPSVVYITTTQRVVNPWTRGVSEQPSGTGTGFMWDKQGHIVTNNHVVEGYKTAKIRLSDQRSFDADVIGTSEQHDLAVLKLRNRKDMPAPVQIGSSRELKVGQTVLAIGNPFGLDHTLTTGILSALGRSIEAEGSSSMADLIQTDASINPGNSGGPLLDSSGRVIGVNAAIYSPSGASAGIGFAIPIDTVNRVVPQLIQNGHYVRPILGITMNDDVSERVADRLGVKGVLVLDVANNSPADKAGLRGTQLTQNEDLVLGDFIQAIDGKPITKSSDLITILDGYKLNDTVKLSLLRDSRPVEVEARLTMQK